MNEHENVGQSEYEHGRFSLNKDGAIIDELGDFPPILLVSNYIDDGSEPNSADRRSVLYLLNELSDNNPNENKHWYLKYQLDRSWNERDYLKDQVDKLSEENQQLKQTIVFADKIMQEEKDYEEMIKQWREYND